MENIYFDEKYSSSPILCKSAEFKAFANLSQVTFVGQMKHRWEGGAGENNSIPLKTEKKQKNKKKNKKKKEKKQKKTEKKTEKTDMRWEPPLLPLALQIAPARKTEKKQKKTQKNRKKQI